jgi:hypothetical protein
MLEKSSAVIVMSRQHVKDGDSTLAVGRRLKERCGKKDWKAEDYSEKRKTSR